jgi:hypothetical protein
MATNSPPSFYKNLDEPKIIEKLPQPLQSLLTLRQLSKDMVVGTAVRSARKALEDNTKKVDAAYLEALADYVGSSGETDGEEDKDEDTKEDEILDKDEAYDRAQCLALLYRYSAGGAEQRSIASAYKKAVNDYVQHVSPAAASLKEEETATVSV